MERDEEVEILVHITARCRAGDDVRYRALAQAYLDFEPSSQTTALLSLKDDSAAGASRQPEQEDSISLSSSILSSSQSARLEVSRTPGSPRKLNLIPTSSPGEDAWVPPCAQRPRLSNTESSPVVGSFNSPDVSFGSVWDNLNSPRIVIQAAERPGALDSGDLPQGSWERTSSVVEDSNPHNDISMNQFNSPSRTLEQYLLLSGGSIIPRSPELPHPATRASFDEPLGDHPVVATTSSSDARPGSIQQTDVDDSLDGGVVICSQSSTGQASHGPSQSSGRESQTSINVGSKRLRRSALEQLDTSPVRADSEPPPRKRIDRGVPETAQQSLARSLSDLGPLPLQQASISNKTEISADELRARCHDLYLEKLEIHPGDPPVSMKNITPADLITMRMQQLATDLEITKRFKPVGQLRELQPFERGHWFVDCADWDKDLVKTTWGFIANWIGFGLAGWGVWCKRDESWLSIRVYCWGHVVGHMYLVLYLASRRKLKYTGASWMDGAGNVLLKTIGATRA